MSAIHHEYYPIEVLEKELILMEKIEKSLSDSVKIKYEEKHKDLLLRIKQLNKSIEYLKQLTRS